jgi:hypothetical protein
VYANGHPHGGAQNKKVITLNRGESTMAEEQKAENRASCNYTQCILNWLKVVDDWSIGGFKNKLPRLYYVVAAVLVLIFWL